MLTLSRKLGIPLNLPPPPRNQHTQPWDVCILAVSVSTFLCRRLNVVMYVSVWWRRGRTVSPSEGRHVCECVVETGPRRVAV